MQQPLIVAQCLKNSSASPDNKVNRAVCSFPLLSENVMTEPISSDECIAGSIECYVCAFLSRKRLT